jgi:hypothetical protein
MSLLPLFAVAVVLADEEEYHYCAFDSVAPLFDDRSYFCLLVHPARVQPSDFSLVVILTYCEPDFSIYKSMYIHLLQL